MKDCKYHAWKDLPVAVFRHLEDLPRLLSYSLEDPDYRICIGCRRMEVFESGLQKEVSRSSVEYRTALEIAASKGKV